MECTHLFNFACTATCTCTITLNGHAHISNLHCQLPCCCALLQVEISLNEMLHAALTVGFHGFLRCGELVNLTRDDITLAADLTALSVRIRHSKTDQSGKGFTLLIGPSPDQEVCPVRAIQQYLSLNFLSSHAQLFTYRSGAALSKQDISREIRNLLPLCGVVCPEEYATHSLRIGVATAAAIAEVPEHLIRHIGRWKSDAALKYIRVCSVEVSQLSAKLASVE